MSTFNPDEILTQAQIGQIHPDWRVLYPQRSYFIKNLFGCIFLIALSVVAFYYITHSDTVLVPGYSSDPLSQSDFQLWRIIDYTFIGILFVTAIIGLLQSLLNANASQKPMLILTPEGFILQQGRKTHTINYAEVVTLKMNTYRSQTTLNIKTISSGKKSLKIVLDGRFGNARQIATGIINTQRSYAANAIPQRY